MSYEDIVDLSSRLQIAAGYKLVVDENGQIIVVIDDSTPTPPVVEGHTASLLADQLMAAAPLMGRSDALRRLHLKARAFCSKTGCWAVEADLTGVEPAADPSYGTTEFVIPAGVIPASAVGFRVAWSIGSGYSLPVFVDPDRVRFMAENVSPDGVRVALELVPNQTPETGMPAFNYAWASRYGAGLVAGVMEDICLDPFNPAYSPASLPRWQHEYANAVAVATRDSMAGGAMRGAIRMVPGRFL